MIFCSIRNRPPFGRNGARLLASLILLSLPSGLVLRAAETPAAQVEFFETKIRPIFVEHCFRCHSQREGKTEGDLALDSRDGILTGGTLGPAIVLGKPAESRLLQAIRREAAELSMPPEGKPLSEAQIQLIAEWIAAGAIYPPVAEGIKRVKADLNSHWSFQPIKKPPVPDVGATPWPQGNIDKFLLAKLQTAGIEPATDAVPEVLARRLSLVLTGLPPTLPELDTFLAAYQANPKEAKEKYVDQLLGSPHFGERWARHWLDLVRYADSAGHEYDYEIPGAWQYRDYVVRAFNADLPWTDFFQEQIAGDLLPPRLVEQRNETLLATSWWNLGAEVTAPVDLSNDEGERLDNKLDVLGKAFSGLTIGCARCHDHKFDPITTREYYGLLGVVAATPTTRIWSNGAQLEASAAELLKLRNRRDTLQTASAGKIAAVSAPELGIESAKLVANFTQGVPADWFVAGHVEAITPQTATLRGKIPSVASGTLSPKLPALIRSPQFTIAEDYIDLLVQGEEATVQVVIANFQMIRSPIYDGLRKPIGNKEWHWIRLHVGRWKGERAHVEVFTGKVNNNQRILHVEDTASAQFAVAAVVHGDGDDRAVPAMPNLPALATPVLIGPIAVKMAKLMEQIPAPERFLAVSEMTGKDLPIFVRGDAKKPRGPVTVRGSLLAWKDSAESYGTGSGRLGLAQALTSPHNPLPARVLANRLWQHVFGRGIVTTVDDFGQQGERPSHPDLLDYLAERLQNQHRGSIKQMLKEMVLSHAFATASRPNLPADPENRLLGHYPLRRLDAESVRDSILVAAGNLDRKVGGPWIPITHRLENSGTDEGLYPENGPADGNRRRTIYLAVWRNIPSLFLDAFDRPPPLTTFGRRDVTTVPAQSLALLNDPLVVGQAELWGTRMAEEKAPPDDRITRMFRAALGRPPTEPELAGAREIVGEEVTGWQDLALALFNAKEFIYVP